MALHAIREDDLPILVDHLVVVAAEAAERVAMTDVVRVGGFYMMHRGCY